MRVLVLLVILPVLAHSLDCIQCDRSGNWYSDEEQTKHIELCQRGEILPTPCRNRTHSHCIVSWFRNGDSKKRIVTERRCGTIEEATGCTLYNSKISRKVRHLIARETGSPKRESANLFVEVCSEACPGGECVSESTSHFVPLIAFTTLLIWNIW